MKKADFKMIWRKAALIAGFLVGSTLICARLVENLSNSSSFIPPVTGRVAIVLKYVSYLLAIYSVLALKFVLKLIRPALEREVGTPQGKTAAMLRQVVMTSSVCITPAYSGFFLFLLTGAYRDFYLLAVFSVVMSTINFPRYSRWQGKIESECGPLED